jgi:hypothetical protein
MRCSFVTPTACAALLSAALLNSACATAPEGTPVTVAKADAACPSERVVQTGSILKRCPDKTLTNATVPSDQRPIFQTTTGFPKGNP